MAGPDGRKGLGSKGTSARAPSALGVNRSRRASEGSHPSGLTGLRLVRTTFWETPGSAVPGNEVDALDFAIYRYLSPEGEARFWAGRRVVDPRVTAREIGERVGISENGVRSRLRNLTKRGFLRGTAVSPNPSLFGVRTQVAKLPVKEPGDVKRIFRDLALVDGVIFARDTLDEDERTVQAYFVSDTPRTMNRRAALLRRLSPTGELTEPTPYWIPSCERSLSPLDWRMLQTVRLHPDSSIAKIAEAQRISLKTAARHYHELIEARACWWTLGPDSEEFPLALISVQLAGSAQRDAVVGEILREGPGWMPVSGDGLGLEPTRASAIVAGLVPIEAPTILERTVARISELRGVARVRRTFALGSMTYPDWFTERIADRVPARP